MVVYIIVGDLESMLVLFNIKVGKYHETMLREIRELHSINGNDEIRWLFNKECRRKEGEKHD